MTILFISDPNGKYPGRLEGQQKELPVAAFYERPLAFRHGIFIETYRNIGPGLSPSRHLAAYVGLRRSGELTRRFDPRRLP